MNISYSWHILYPLKFHRMSFRHVEISKIKVLVEQYGFNVDDILMLGEGSLRPRAEQRDH